MTTKKDTTSKPAAKVKTQKIMTAVNRPSAGRLMFAHTLAALEVLGMLKTKAEQRKARTPGAVSTLIGATALRHHTKNTGAFARNDDGNVVLTDHGLGLFAGRAGRLGYDQRTDQVAEGSVIKDMVAAMKKGGQVQGIKFTEEKEIKA